jgi:hypothetical protein
MLFGLVLAAAMLFVPAAKAQETAFTCSVGKSVASRLVLNESAGTVSESVKGRSLYTEPAQYTDTQVNWEHVWRFSTGPQRTDYVLHLETGEFTQRPHDGGAQYVSHCAVAKKQF